MIENAATWGQFRQAAPEFAESGARLFDKWQIAYLASVDRKGAPRVHPVTPVLFEEGLYLFIPESTPKGKDLVRTDRFAMHAMPGKNDEEFYIKGIARRVENPLLHKEVYDSITFTTGKDDPLYELQINKCLWSYWENVGKPGTYPVRQRWICH